MHIPTRSEVIFISASLIGLGACSTAPSLDSAPKINLGDIKEFVTDHASQAKQIGGAMVNAAATTAECAQDAGKCLNEETAKAVGGQLLKIVCEDDVSPKCVAIVAGQAANIATQLLKTREARVRLDNGKEVCDYMVSGNLFNALNPTALQFSKDNCSLPAGVTTIG